MDGDFLFLNSVAVLLSLLKFNHGSNGDYKG